MTPQIVESITSWLQLIILVGTVVTLIYTLAKFAAKPNQTQDDRLDDLESWKTTAISRLNDGDDHFRKLDEANEAQLEALLAMLSHEISGNDIEKLKSARAKLEKYLISK